MDYWYRRVKMGLNQDKRTILQGEHRLGQVLASPGASVITYGDGSELPPYLSYTHYRGEGGVVLKDGAFLGVRTYIFEPIPEIALANSNAVVVAIVDTPVTAFTALKVDTAALVLTATNDLTEQQAQAMTNSWEAEILTDTGTKTVQAVAVRLTGAGAASSGTPPPPSTLTLDKTTLNGQIGSTGTVTANITITATSSDDAVATVTVNGKVATVTYVAAGSADIIITNASDSNDSKTVAVTINSSSRSTPETEADAFKKSKSGSNK
jgi:hypothetical protein